MTTGRMLLYIVFIEGCLASLELNAETPQHVKLLPGETTGPERFIADVSDEEVGRQVASQIDLNKDSQVSSLQRLVSKSEECPPINVKGRTKPVFSSTCVDAFVRAITNVADTALTDTGNLLDYVKTMSECEVKVAGVKYYDKTCAAFRFSKTKRRSHYLSKKQLDDTSTKDRAFAVLHAVDSIYACYFEVGKETRWDEKCVKNLTDASLDMMGSYLTAYFPGKYSALREVERAKDALSKVVTCTAYVGPPDYLNGAQCRPDLQLDETKRVLLGLARL